MADSGLGGSCVYLLVERDYLRAGVHLVVKVGRSTRIEARVRAYPKHSRLICATRVCDAVAAEAALLRAFTSDFARRADLGNEYFQVAGASAQTKGAGIVLAHHVFSKAVSEFVSLGPEYTDGDTGSEGDEPSPDQSLPLSDDSRVAGTSAPPQPAEATTVAPPIDSTLAEFMHGVRATRGGEWCSGEELYGMLNEWLVRRNDADVRITCARMLTGINALYRPTWQRRNDVMMMLVPRQPQYVEGGGCSPSDDNNTTDPHVQGIIDGLQAMLNFDPPRPDTLKGKQYYAWLRERDIVDLYWSMHGRDLKREGCPKPELRKLVRVAMSALGRRMHSRLRTHQGEVHTAYDRVAFRVESVDSGDDPLRCNGTPTRLTRPGAR